MSYRITASDTTFTVYPRSNRGPLMKIECTGHVIRFSITVETSDGQKTEQYAYLDPEDREAFSKWVRNLPSLT